MQDRKDLKALIYQVAAATDRGQRMNAMIAPMYQNKLVAVSYTHLTLPTILRV